MNFIKEFASFKMPLRETWTQFNFAIFFGDRNFFSLPRTTVGQKAALCYASKLVK